MTCFFPKDTYFKGFVFEIELKTIIEIIKTELLSDISMLEDFFFSFFLVCDYSEDMFYRHIWEAKLD